MPLELDQMEGDHCYYGDSRSAAGSETATVHAEAIDDDSEYEPNGKIIAKIVNSTTVFSGCKCYEQK